MGRLWTLHCPQIAAAADDLSNDNLSTARDMSRALLALSADPTLAMTASAPSWTLAAQGRAPRMLFSTNRLTGRSDLNVLAAKTGYTDTAGYCFTGLVEGEDGRRLLVTVLGAPSSGSRWADVERLLGWARG
jgi:D-alanyl-D-alanine carboxypeptidase